MRNDFCFVFSFEYSKHLFPVHYHLTFWSVSHQPASSSSPLDDAQADHYRRHDFFWLPKKINKINEAFLKEQKNEYNIKCYVLILVYIKIICIRAISLPVLQNIDTLSVQVDTGVRLGFYRNNKKIPNNWENRNFNYCS